MFRGVARCRAARPSQPRENAIRVGLCLGKVKFQTSLQGLLADPMRVAPSDSFDQPANCEVITLGLC